MKSPGFLIDDFSREDGLSAAGTRWQLFTDQVMGGLSEGTARLVNFSGRRSVRLQGRVSLANNGGFIQVALPLEKEGKPFDASAYRGLRIWARGNGELYQIHLRTADAELPWQYYWMGFSAADAWKRITLPFSKFKPETLEARLDPGRLTRVAIAAAGKAFKADVAVSGLEFYR